jgi:nitroreductase
MNIVEAIKSRKTIRGFKETPVPASVIEEIIDIARRAPSNCNTQPWHFAVVSGGARQNLEARLLEEAASGKAPYPAFGHWDKGISGQYQQRRHQCAAELYGVLGIEREDKDGRNAQTLKNWRFFGAPHVGFISMPSSLGILNAVDVGIFLQTLMLLFVEYGLASCPQVALGYFPGPVHEIAKIPEGNGIVCGISFGYADDSARVNRVRMGRATVEEISTLVE